MININQIELSAFLEEDYTNLKSEKLKLKNGFLKTNYLKLKDILPVREDKIEEITEELKELNKILKKANLQVGYRIRDEINFYIIQALDKNLLNQETFNTT
jgi:hypothetical protein